MPRASRNFPGGMVYHVLNRGVGRWVLLEKDGDFLAFERVGSGLKNVRDFGLVNAVNSRATEGNREENAAVKCLL